MGSLKGEAGCTVVKRLNEKGLRVMARITGLTFELKSMGRVCWWQEPQSNGVPANCCTSIPADDCVV